MRPCWMRLRKKLAAQTMQHPWPVAWHSARFRRLRAAPRAPEPSGELRTARKQRCVSMLGKDANLTEGHTRRHLLCGSSLDESGLDTAVYARTWKRDGESGMADPGLMVCEALAAPQTLEAGQEVTTRGVAV